MADPSSLLLSLGTLVEKGAALALSVREGIGHELKDDGTIVTEADRRVETFLRPELAGLLPDTEVWGEEQGFSLPGRSGLWLVDPVDGTSNFAFGSPLWGVTVGLLQDGVLTMGAVCLPELGETFLAERGRGAWLNGVAMDPIPPGPVRDEELVSFGYGVARKFPRLPGRMRLSGAFVVDGTFVGTQRIRGMIGMREKLYDVAAVVVMVRELGGDVRYANGEPFIEADLLRDERIARPWLLFPAESGFNLG